MILRDGFLLTMGNHFGELKLMSEDFIHGKSPILQTLDLVSAFFWTRYFQMTRIILIRSNAKENGEQDAYWMILSVLQGMSILSTIVAIRLYLHWFRKFLDSWIQILIYPSIYLPEKFKAQESLTLPSR
jgi:hypothetical protein